MTAGAFPELFTARCRLVAPRSEHVPLLLEVFGDAEAMRFMQSTPLENLEACHRKLETWGRDAEAGKGLRWIVLQEAIPVGVFALHYLSQVHRRAELGCYLCRSAWGQGLGLELTQEVLRFAFRELNLHRVELRCDPRNAASMAVARRLGMTLEGILRDFVFVEGRGFVDEAVHSLLESEFR